MWRSGPNEFPTFTLVTEDEPTFGTLFGLVFAYAIVMTAKRMEIVDLYTEH